MANKNVFELLMEWRNGYAPDQVSRITWGELKDMMDSAGVDDDDELVVNLGGKYGANYYGISSVEEHDAEESDEKYIKESDKVRYVVSIQYFDLSDSPSGFASYTVPADSRASAYKIGIKKFFKNLPDDFNGVDWVHATEVQ